jgi:hypothetical protein
MRTLNIEHRTSNVEVQTSLHVFTSMFNVGCWMFDVRIFLGWK